MNLASEKYTNHLIHESSPYLLQHAHNPVDWFPWGVEALKKAKDENKLLLISIGYAACHWCHVMEHESFENDEVAKVMNENFVCIKVDREERPDIDQIYMNAVQLLSGSGGWPLNCFALPDGKPFYGGTYFPPKQWMLVLQKVSEEYRLNPEKVKEFADQLTDGVKQNELVTINTTPPQFLMNVLNDMVNNWQNNFDNKEGGPNRAPKFPLPTNYQFLLRYEYHTKDKEILNHILLTLNKMALGGIYDQLGGGFARYSTDKHWLAPHFEKMLYDNGQLVSLYAEAYQATKFPLYKEIVYETIEWVRREMTSPENGFYSSLDADSEGEEGKFYVWEKSEIEDILKEDAGFFCEYYNVNSLGNWEHGKNILHRSFRNDDFAKMKNISEDSLIVKLKNLEKKLLDQRSKRIWPGLDDKILTEWNALMLQGIIDAYRVFNDPLLLDMALKNAEFIIKYMKHKNRLDRNFKKGKSNINGYLSDYSFTIEAFISLYQATFDEQWLHIANELMEHTLAHFFDEKSGMFYFTSDEDPELIARKSEINDNVIPASNSSIAKGLYLLGTLLYKEKYLQISKQMLNTIQKYMPSYGSGYSNWGILMLLQIHQPFEIAIVGNNARSLRQELDTYYIPNKIVLGGKTEGSIPLLSYKSVPGKTMVYVCKNKICKLPVEQVSEAVKQMTNDK